MLPLALATGIAGMELQPFSSVHSRSFTMTPFTHATGRTMFPIAKSIVSIIHLDVI